MKNFYRETWEEIIVGMKGFLKILGYAFFGIGFTIAAAYLLISLWM